MGIFKKDMTNTDQGNIGLVKAIYELQMEGYRLSVPLTENQAYDLIGDKNGILYKIQVKTTKNKSEYGIFETNLRTLGGNQSFHKIKKRKNGDYDLLYILTDDDNSYLIPENDLGKNTTSISLGKKYEKFRIYRSIA